jgi:methionyl-tRNA formyltransferase
VIRAAFLGTPAEAVPILGGLLEVAEVGVVITQPDRPRGRSGRPQHPPVRVAAEEWGLEVLQPGRLGDVAERLVGCDIAVVAAFGRIIPAAVLAVPRRGFVNVHYSLLPRWRGASPVVRAILAGDDTTGVTLMEMDEGLDTGRIVATEVTQIRPDETAGELTMRLAGLGRGLVMRRLGAWVEGDLPASPQDDALATAAAKVSVTEAFIDPARHRAGAVVRAIRAFNPRPGAWGRIDGERMKLWRAMPSDATGVAPGWATLSPGRVLLGCADGAVELLLVQPAGRGSMDAVDWMHGRRGEPAVFEQATGG